MKLYLDTNVYSFIASRDEARRVRSFLDEQQHVALVSCNHLAETWRIEDQERRVREMRCLTAVASPTSYSGLPESYIQAQEVLAEMRRLRPGWLALVPDDTSRISVFLNFHRRDWSAVRRDPSYVPPGQSLVKASVESAMPRNREAHRELRDLILRLRRLNLEPGLRLHSEFS